MESLNAIQASEKLALQTYSLPMEYICILLYPCSILSANISLLVLLQMLKTLSASYFTLSLYHIYISYLCLVRFLYIFMHAFHKIVIPCWGLNFQPHLLTSFQACLDIFFLDTSFMKWLSFLVNSFSPLLVCFLEH